MKTTRRQFLAILAALAVVRIVPNSPAPVAYAIEAGEPSAQCGA